MLRREGVRRLLVRVAVVAGSVFYRCVVIHGRDLSEPLPEATSALPVEIRLLKATDAAALARHRVDLEPARVAARLQRLADGQACVAAWLDDQIVSSTWLAFDTAWLPQLHRRLSLSPNEVFIYDTYTIEPMRGRGSRDDPGAVDREIPARCRVPVRDRAYRSREQAGVKGRRRRRDTGHSGPPDTFVSARGAGTSCMSQGAAVAGCGRTSRST